MRHFLEMHGEDLVDIIVAFIFSSQALISYKSSVSQKDIIISNYHMCHLVGWVVVSIGGVFSSVALAHHVGHIGHPLQPGTHLLHPQTSKEFNWSGFIHPRHRHMAVRQSGTVARGCNTKLCRDFVRYSISQRLVWQHRVLLINLNPHKQDFF